MCHIPPPPLRSQEKREKEERRKERKEERRRSRHLSGIFNLTLDPMEFHQFSDARIPNLQFQWKTFQGHFCITQEQV